MCVYTLLWGLHSIGKINKNKTVRLNVVYNPGPFMFQADHLWRT